MLPARAGRSAFPFTVERAMSNQQHSGFGQFIPGFDFLQSLAKGASASIPNMPNLSSWVAPTLNVEELEKRIGELKAVQFWLEQNRTALAATIQALEVQKMTLATLRGMNFNMAELAAAMKVKPTAAPASAAAAASAEPAAAPNAGKHGGHKGKQGNGRATGATSQVVDPLQWWGALTQQFQEIAATAMRDVAASADAPGAKAPPAKTSSATSDKAKPAKTTRRAPRKAAAD